MPKPLPIRRPLRQRLLVPMELALVGALVLAACGGSSPSEDTTIASAPTTIATSPADQASTTTAGAPASTTTAGTEPIAKVLYDPPSPPVAVCDLESAEAMCIEMRSLTFEGDTVVVDWAASNFTPDTGAFHAHFYWNTVRPQEAGTNAASFGASPGSWELTDQTPFRSGSLSASSIPAGTTGLCAIVANGNHGAVDPTIEHCLPLPDLVADADGYLEFDRVFMPLTEACVTYRADGSQTAAATPSPGSQFQINWADPTSSAFSVALDDVVFEGEWQSTAPAAPLIVATATSVTIDTESAVRFQLDRSNIPECS